MSERKMPKPEDYPSNADIKKEETRPATLHGKVRHKTSIWKMARDEFLSEDIDHMGNDLVQDILFPALKNLVNDLLHGAIDAAFNSDGGSRRRSDKRRGSWISYDRYYDDDDRRRKRRRDKDDDYDRRRVVLDCSEYKFEYRDDADYVFEMMCDRLEQYGEVTVAYFFDKVGETIPGAWSGEDWGWTNFAGVKVRGSQRNGWYIDLPRAKEL